jgi:hypothetical protein
VFGKIFRSRKLIAHASRKSSEDPSEFLTVKRRIVYLIGIIILSFLIVWIPHSNSVNSDDQIIGSDTKDYERLLIDMNSATTVQEFINAFVSQVLDDRSLSLITFYILSQFINPSNLIASLEMLPFVLAPLLILTIYYLTMELTSSPFTSIVSSFLSAISFHVLIGMYGGLYANWFALIFVNLAILYLIRSVRVPSKRNIFLFSVLLIVILLSHESTWPIIIFVISIFLIVLLVFKLTIRRTIYHLALAVAPSLILEVLKSLLTRQSGVIQNISFASSQGLGVHDASIIWNNLVVSTQTYLAGQFNNSIIFGLVLYWILRCELRDKSQLLLIIFLSIPMLPILFGDSEVTSRVLYEIPFQIPAAIVLVQLKKFHGNLLFLTICIWLVALSIRSSLNFHFDT